MQKNEIYRNGIDHLRYLKVPILTELPGSLAEFDAIADAIFGYTFNGWRGEGKDFPYDAIITALVDSMLPVIALDCPSG